MTVSRIPLIDPEDLTPLQAEVYRNSPAGKLNLFRLLAHAKTIYPGFSQMIQAVFTGLDLPPLEREIVILAVLHLDRGEYEWAQHLQVADAMGVPKGKVDAIAQEKFNADVFDAREQALLSFTRQVVKTVRVDPCVFDAVAAFYSPRQIVEMIFAIGLYMTILRVSEAAELQLDAVLGASVMRAATKSE